MGAVMSNMIALPEQARAFLHLLDPRAEQFTFQTFEDTAAKITKAELARVHQGAADLDRYYRAGAGVWVTVNETDLRGRKRENIVRVRTVFQEDDTGHTGPFPLAPSITVTTSPGHFHRYWLVADHWPADEQGRGDFTAVMERMIASHGSDKSAKDISRVLRVPGFLHRKHEPFMVRIVDAPGYRYARAEIMAAFPPIARQAPRPASPWRAREDDDHRMADALRAIPADDRDVWLEVGMALHAHLGAQGRDLWDSWSQSSTKYNAADSARIWGSFRKSGITIATLFHHARLAGWRPTIRETERPVWSKAGYFLSYLHPQYAHDAFRSWLKLNPIVSGDRAEFIFATLLQKELGR
jgi:hypothetical protein